MSCFKPCDDGDLRLPLSSPAMNSVVRAVPVLSWMGTRVASISASRPGSAQFPYRYIGFEMRFEKIWIKQRKHEGN